MLDDNFEHGIFPFIGEMGGDFEIPSVSVIIPTLNESRNLPYVLPRIPRWVREVIIVDGRSHDDTIDVAIQLFPEARVVMEPSPGKGTALRTGFREAHGEIIVMLDADGSMAPEEIPVFVGAIMAGADFVKGSRFMQGGGTDDMEFHRRLGNWGLMMLARMLFGGKYSDFCYGYAAFKRSTLIALDLRSTGFEIETEMNVRALQTRLKIAEVPSFEYPREYGNSNLNAVRDGLRIVRTMWRELIGTHRIYPDNTYAREQRDQVFRSWLFSLDQ